MDLGHAGAENNPSLDAILGDLSEGRNRRVDPGRRRSPGLEMEFIQHLHV
jgi:hypothetical protein